MTQVLDQNFTRLSLIQWVLKYLEGLEIIHKLDDWQRFFDDRHQIERKLKTRNMFQWILFMNLLFIWFYESRANVLDVFIYISWSTNMKSIFDVTDGKNRQRAIVLWQCVSAYRTEFTMTCILNHVYLQGKFFWCIIPCISPLKMLLLYTLSKLKNRSLCIFFGLF